MELAFQRLRSENVQHTSSPHGASTSSRNQVQNSGNIQQVPSESRNIPLRQQHDEREENHTTAKVMDQMRKWNCHFDGRDLYSFLERVRELQRAYKFTDEEILRGYPELLRGDARNGAKLTEG